MGNLPPLLDLICGFRTGRRLSDQPGTGFGCPGWDRRMAPMEEALRRANVDSWRTGRCFPWWRNRPGYDHIEPWPPAALAQLGRRLLGLDDWPSDSEQVVADAKAAAPSGIAFCGLATRPGLRPCARCAKGWLVSREASYQNLTEGTVGRVPATYMAGVRSRPMKRSLAPSCDFGR
jgi:hypothetical protein